MGCIFCPLGGCIFFHVVYFAPPMLYILPDPEAKKRVRGAREHTLGGSPPAIWPPARRRHAPRPEQTIPRPGRLLYATAEHTSRLQNFLAAEKRAELWRSPAETFLSWGGVRDTASCAVGSTMMRDLMSVVVWIITIQRDAQVESLSSIHRKMLSENHAVAC